MSLAWAVVTAGAVVAGAAWTAIWLAVVCGVAAAHAARSQRCERRRPPPPLAATGAVLVVGSALAGPLAPLLVATAILACAAVATLVPSWALMAPLRTGAIAVVVAGCGAAMVVDRAQGPGMVLVLLAMAAAYDTGSYLVGSGVHNSWEGPVAGIAAIGAVTLALAAATTISHPGPGAWALGGVAALFAPAGTYLASALLGEPQTGAGALRRLDSLLLLAPVWAVLAPRLLS